MGMKSPYQVASGGSNLRAKSQSGEDLSPGAVTFKPPRPLVSFGARPCGPGTGSALRVAQGELYDFVEYGAEALAREAGAAGDPIHVQLGLLVVVKMSQDVQV